MKLATITKALLLVVIVALCGWTTVCMLAGVPGDTVSEQVRYYSFNFPILTLAVGFVLGHWFWPGPPPPQHPNW